MHSITRAIVYIIQARVSHDAFHVEQLYAPLIPHEIAVVQRLCPMALYLYSYWSRVSSVSVTAAVSSTVLLVPKPPAFPESIKRSYLASSIQ